MIYTRDAALVQGLCAILSSFVQRIRCNQAHEAFTTGCLMTVSGRVCLAILISLALGATPLAAVQVATGIAPLAEQGRLLGPLLTKDEQLAWDALRGDVARADFVRTFWVVRDPTPGTADNERRDIFEARARIAMDQFAEGTIPGYATDRGRVMLVYGLPDELELRAVPAGTAPTLTWIYTRHVPAVTVLFATEGEGFRLEGEPELSSQAFMHNLGGDLRLRLATAVGGQHGALAWPETPVSESELPESDPESDEGSPAADPEASEDGAAVEPPIFDAAPGVPPPEIAPEVKIWMEMVFSGVEREELELRWRLHFFPAPEGTYSALTFEVGKALLEFVAAAPETEPVEQSEAEAASEMELSAEQLAAAHMKDLAAREAQEASADLRVFGAFLQGESGQENTIHSFIIPYDLMESAGDDDSSPALSLGVTLSPGSYRLAWGVLDATTGRAVTRDETVEIPDYGQGSLGLTRPLLAAEEIRDDPRPMSTATVYQGIRLGNVLVANDIDNMLDRDATVEVVAVVTGWASDPAAPGKPRLEVVYRILEGLEGERSLARLPEQLLDFHVLGQQIPLAQVRRLQPGNSYRIEVRVKDLVSGEETVQRAPIHLRAVPLHDSEDAAQ
jgi:GWxTD domain-containing protein